MAYIGLDIGHGSNTFPPNKGVYRNGKGYAEYDFNRKLGKRVKELLEQNGHKVILGQPLNGKDVPLITRTNLYNREKVDLVLSLHANAGASNVSGRCAFYWGTSSKSKTLAQAVINEIKAKGYSTHGNGLHAGVRGTWTNLHINRETNMPAVLIEHGFMTNASDFQLIFGNKQNEYIEDMAQADVAGVVKWLGGKPVKPSKPSKPSKPAKPSTGSDGLYGARLVKNENAFFLATENIKVRNAPSVTAKHTGTLPKGSSINYKKVYEGNGYRWLQYTGNSGNKLYLPYRESGSGKEQWGTFHDKRPSGTSTAKPNPKANNLTVDGYLGSDTVKALQKKYGLVVDGEIWGQYSGNQATKAFNQKAVKYGKGGSPVVRELQKTIGVTADGIWGIGTTRALQRYLGTPVDGIVSRPSTAIKELQRRLNAGTF